MKPRDPSSLRAIRPAPRRIAVASAFFARILLLASMAIGGSIWALVRFYTHTRPPMVVPIPSASAEWSTDAGLIVAPEIER